MAKNLSSRLVSLGISCGLLLGLHGTANAVPLPAPELDPGTATGGIMLAVGAALLLLERFRHRQ